MHCKLCYSQGLNNHGNQTRLVGGFFVTLCDSCLNKWDRFARPSAEYQRLEELQTKIEANEVSATCSDSIRYVHEESHINLTKLKRKVEGKLWLMGKKWVAENSGGG